MRILLFSVLVFSLLLCCLEAFQPSSLHGRRNRAVLLHASVVTEQQDVVLHQFEEHKAAAVAYVDSMHGLHDPDAALYALFLALTAGGENNVRLGVQGTPGYWTCEQLEQAWGGVSGCCGFQGLFTMEHLEQALEDDFLDAARGSTDNRKGWEITDVSVPRGDSFHEARMTFADVQSALDRGTVIFNAAGAHIPRLAGPTLACTDATILPCALNLYVTAPAMRTSAPPHTDAQDVVVVQTAGRKRWSVYEPLLEAADVGKDVFARGKGSDSVPLYRLKEEGTLVISTVLEPGDVLYIPAGFPHTTSTVVDDNDAETSVHLTFGIDHHIWDLDYAAARRLALQRKGVKDVLAPYPPGPNGLADSDLRSKLLKELPLGFVEGHDDTETTDRIIHQLEDLSKLVDKESASQLSRNDWQEAVERLRQQGNEIFETHRDMYLAAIEEGQKRAAEESMRAHLGPKEKVEMTPDRVQRLSLFRVKKFYDQINESKGSLQQWAVSGSVAADDASSSTDANWPLTATVKVGDEVEADLGGAFFSAKVTRASEGTFDVAFFDGDRETGLSRDQIKLLSPPTASADTTVDTSHMTAKQLKRWKKQQEKLNKQL